MFLLPSSSAFALSFLVLIQSFEGVFLFVVLFLFGAVFHHVLTFCLDPPYVVVLHLLMQFLYYAASLPLMIAVGPFAFCLATNSLSVEFVFLLLCAMIV